MGAEASPHLPAMSITNTDMKSCCDVTHGTMVTAQLGFGGSVALWEMLLLGTQVCAPTTKEESKSGEGPSTAPQPTHDTKQ